MRDGRGAPKSWRESHPLFVPGPTSRPWGGLGHRPAPVTITSRGGGVVNPAVVALDSPKSRREFHQLVCGLDAVVDPGIGRITDRVGRSAPRSCSVASGRKIRAEMDRAHAGPATN